MISLNGLVLSNDLNWADRYNWTPVVQKTERSLTGALLVQPALKIKGRKIKLTAESNVGWMPRDKVVALYGYAASPGLQMTFIYRGVTENVIFDHEATAIQANLAMPYVDENNNDWIRVESINLLTF